MLHPLRTRPQAQQLAASVMGLAGLGLIFAPEWQLSPTVGIALIFGGFGTLSNYAALRIRGALLDELRRLDCLPRANRAKAKSLQATIQTLESKLKRTPTEIEIRKELSLSDKEYSTLLKDTQPITFVPIESSSDGSDEGDGRVSLIESLHEPTDQTSSEVLEQKEKVAILKDLIKDLPKQQKQILMLYYYEELRLSEIAEIFSLTEGRISQILSQCILNLKSKFKTIN